MTCKAYNCERKAKKDGFCGHCIKKVAKDLLTSDGKKTLKVELQDRNKKQRLKRLLQQQALKEVNNTKREIRSKLTLPILKTIIDEDPELTEPFFCKSYDFYIDPGSCMSRLFVQDTVKKHCRKCTVYDGKVKDYLVLVDSHLERENN